MQLQLFPLRQSSIQPGPYTHHILTDAEVFDNLGTIYFTMLSQYFDPFVLTQEYVASVEDAYPTPVTKDLPAILSMPPTPDISNATLTSGHRVRAPRPPCMNLKVPTSCLILLSPPLPSTLNI